jgi:hypothetical protein
MTRLGKAGAHPIEDEDTMTPLYHDPHYTFRFEDERRIPRFYLEGVGAGRSVSVFKIDASGGERLGLLATATVGKEDPAPWTRSHPPMSSW